MPLRSPLSLYRELGRRFNGWINQKPHRGEHFMQAMIGVNMVAGIGLLTQVQRWRLGSFDEHLDGDISATRPQLWKQYEQDMADSVRISELREEELRAEAAERAAQGLSPDHSAPERVVRTYVIDGRERRVVFVNTNPVGFDVRLRRYREAMEAKTAKHGRVALPPTADDSHCGHCADPAAPSHSADALPASRVVPVR